MTPAEQARKWRALADQYRQYEINVLPLGNDKRPVVTGVAKSGRVLHFAWDSWQTIKQDDKLWKQIRSPDWWADVRGVALICGPVSGNLVLVDFDNCTPTPEFWESIGLPEDYAWCYPTPGAGWHVWVRVDQPLQLPGDKGRIVNPSIMPANVERADKPPQVEVRWTGHYGAAPGSQHPDYPDTPYAWRGAAPDAPPTVVTPVTLLMAYWTQCVAPTEDVGHRTVTSVTTALDGGSKFGLAALRSEIDELSRAAAGGRNAALNKAAFALGQLVAGGELDAGAVEAALTETAQAIGLGESETTASIHSGMSAGAKDPRQGKPLASLVDAYDGFGPMPGQTVHVNGNGNGKVAHAVTAVTEEAEKKRDSTWPYAAHGGRMFYQFETKAGIDEQAIADFVVTIVENVADEDGTSLVTLEGRGVRGRRIRCTLRADELGDERALKAALMGATGGIDAIYKGQGPHLSMAISKLTDPDRVRYLQRYRRTGWIDDTCTAFLIPGREIERTIIELPGKLPYSMPGKHALMVPALQAFDALCGAFKPTITVPALAGMFFAGLHRVAGWRNERTAIFISGRTGSLKTSWTQTALCMFGERFINDDQLVKWGEGATRNAIMAMASHAGDMPFLIDNYKPTTGGGRTDFQNLIHNILEGGNKDRLNRDSSLRPPQPIHAIPIVTGEDVPDNDAASLARILVIEFEWQRGEINDRLTEAQDSAHHLPMVGWSWLEWLATEEGRAVAQQAAAQLYDRRRFWAAKLRSVRTDIANALRIATNLAANELTWWVVCRHPVLGRVAQQYAEMHRLGLERIAESMANSASNAMEAHQWRNAVRELLVSGQYVLVHRALPAMPENNEKLLGWKDTNGVYVLPQTALSAIQQRLGVRILSSPNALFRQFLALGWIAKGVERSTKKIAIGNDRPRVLHFRPGVIDGEVEIEDGDGEDGEIRAIQELGL